MKILNAALCFLILPLALSGAVYEEYLDPENLLDAKILKIKTALERQPDNPALHNDLGVLIRQKNFHKDAFREFRKAVKLDKTFYSGWFNMGLYYQETGHPFKAWRAFRKVLKHKPGHDLAEYHLGDLYRSWGMEKRAIRHYAKAFQINHAITNPAYNPGILNNPMMPRVMEFFFRKYRGGSVQPYQMTEKIAWSRLKERFPPDTKPSSELPAVVEPSVDKPSEAGDSSEKTAEGESQKDEGQEQKEDEAKDKEDESEESKASVRPRPKKRPKSSRPPITNDPQQ